MAFYLLSAKISFNRREGGLGTINTLGFTQGRSSHFSFATEKFKSLI